MKNSPWDNLITKIQQNVLVSLARYKYLTMSQMISLKVGTNQYPYLWKQVASLRDRKRALVSCNNFPLPSPKKGRVESLYFLTKEGMNQILGNGFVESEEAIKIPKGKTIAYKDYFHRKFTIDFQIALYQHAEKNEKSVEFFHTYFDKVGDNRINKNLRALTRIDFEGKQFFIPDAVFKINRQFFLFEMYNGKDTKRVLEQLHKHAQALTFRHTHRAYNLDETKSYRIILLFEFESAKEALIKRIQEDSSFDMIRSYFFAKSLNESIFETSNDWNDLNGDIKSLF